MRRIHDYSGMVGARRTHVWMCAFCGQQVMHTSNDLNEPNPPIPAGWGRDELGKVECFECIAKRSDNYDPVI